MEKISRILPSSHRFRKLDIADSPAARPGAIALGKQDGGLPVQERIRFSPESIRMAFQQTLGAKNPMESLAHQRFQELAQELSGEQALDEIFNKGQESEERVP
jgi:hypothetical protein